MGRETARQPVRLTEDGWLRLPDDDGRPQVSIEGPDLAAFEFDAEIEHDDFDEDALNIVYQWLRTPDPEAFYTLRERPGFLRLFGQESPGSLFRQSLIARRQTEGRFIAETSVEF